MPIVGGMDIHRKRLTFDYVDTDTGRLERGRIAPADREHLAGWLRRFEGVDRVAFAVEGCTGWRPRGCLHRPDVRHRHSLDTPA